MTVGSRQESEAVIESFQAKLAHRDLLPDGSHRRNTVVYPLVCYVNNITALLLSENFEPVPIFIARAAEHMAKWEAPVGGEAYYAVATQYLSHVAYHLMTHVGGVEFDDDRIPASMLAAGPQRAPT